MEERNKIPTAVANQNKFFVGITMAGAISAGAYSAGVIDFLLFALNEWEKQKKKDSESIDIANITPTHQVVIPVVSGASAGSIVGAIAFPLIPDDLALQECKYEDIGNVEYCLPKVFDAWVKLTSFTNKSGKNELFGLDDLNNESKVSALLNSNVLDEVIKTTFSISKKSTRTYPFISDNLHLFFTHSNLRGVPYEIDMVGGTAGQPGYSMTMHADRIHYVVRGIGQGTFESPWLDREPVDNFIQLNTNDLSDDVISEDWLGFAEAAVGSGAFPVGLKARFIQTQTTSDYEHRSWTYANISGEFKLPASFKNSDHLHYTTVDGGLFNNEPFEISRWTLMKAPPESNARVESLESEQRDEMVDRCVITIDPFADADKRAASDPDDSLINIIMRILPALKSNARFKPAEALALLDESVYSRYLIAPKRYSHLGQEPHAIACGLLGGFGGFLSEKFRAHDYQLGRRNCYDFLKRHFAIPKEYSTVRNGYKNVGLEQLEEYIKGTAEPDSDQNWLPIIPLVGNAAIQPKLMSWPKVCRPEVDEAVKKAAIRANKVFSHLLKDNIGNWWIRTGLRALWWLYGKRKVKKQIQSVFMRSLKERDQIKLS